MSCDFSPKAADAERRNLHAVLAGCPVGAAVVAHGRLCFANALFAENTRLAAGAEGLSIVFDDGTSGLGHAVPDGKDAVLIWNAADGNACRMRLVARTAPYGGEDAFFLWMAGIADDAPLQAVRHVPASGHGAPEPAPPPASPPARPKARILLAEDNEINQEIAIELLEQVGAAIEVASNGQETVDLFLKKDFDLILMDIQMPVMDGMDATRAIRASGKAGADRVPILAMTAHGMSGDREKSLQAGMNDHITKPIDPQLLYAALDAWIPKRARGSAAPSGAAPAEDKCPPAAADAQAPAPPAPSAAPQQDILSSLQGIDAQAGLSNVAGNRELYLRLLDRFAKNYRNSGLELRDALKRMAHDASAHEEAVRLAHTAKGVAANLGAHALAAVAGELERAVKKHSAQEEMLERYDLLLSEVLDAIESLPKREDTHVGQQAIAAADKKRIAAVLDVLPALMQEDWYNAQQMLLDLAHIVEDTVASAHFREVSMALEEFDSDGVAEKGRLLLAAI